MLIGELFMNIEGVPHLSTRCPTRGDQVSMAPASEPVRSAVDARDYYDSRRQVTYYAVLHLCPNPGCTGATVAQYVLDHSNRDYPYRYRFHVPGWEEYKVPDSVPERPRAILQSANDARHSPIACAAAAVRAVEAMMAEVGYKERRFGLKKRIDKAVEDRKLPPLMADLAHDVREIGNETHTDEAPEQITSQADADRALKFANLLAEYLFVLPAQIAEARPP